MNKLIASLLLILIIACANENNRAQKAPEIAKYESPTLFVGPLYTLESYSIDFQIEKSDNDDYQLSISMILNNGAHYISPYAKRDFKGKFYMDLGAHTDLEFVGDIIETPRSIEEFDPHPFVNGTVNWVRVNTTYYQPLQLKSQKDFEVFGRIQFTIEPRCTFEEIPFVISFKNGEMSVKKNPKC